MKALLRGERAASPLLMGALIGLFAMAVTVLILAAGYRDQFIHLKHVIYQRCQQRSAYDEASQLARRGQQHLYQQLAALDRDHPVSAPGAAALQAARVTDYEAAIHELRRPLVVGAPRGCSAYK